MFKTTKTMKKFENKTQLESYIDDNTTAPLNEVVASNDNEVAYNFDIGNGNWSKFWDMDPGHIAESGKTDTMPTDFSDFELVTIKSSYPYTAITGEFRDANDWSNLETINIPDEIEAIDDGAFSNCTKLTRVVIGKGLKNMSAKAFEGCPLVELIVRSDSWDWKSNKFLGFPYLSYVRVHGHRLNSEELLEFTGGGGYGSGGGIEEDEHFVVLRSWSDYYDKVKPGMSVLITGGDEESILTSLLNEPDPAPNAIFYIDRSAEISSTVRNNAYNSSNFVFLDNEESSNITLDLIHPYWIKFGFSSHYVQIKGESISSGLARGLYLPFNINSAGVSSLPSNVYIFDDNQALTSLSSYLSSDPGARLSHLEYQPLIFNNIGSSTSTYMTLNPNANSVVANFRPTVEDDKVREYTFGDYSVYGSISPDSSYTGRPFVMTGPSQLMFASYLLTDHYGGVYTNRPISGSSQSLNYSNNTWSW